MMLKRCCLAALALLLTLLLPGPAAAQSTDWRELKTKSFTILHAEDDAAAAQRYAGFVDQIYAEIAALFGHATATPVTLRLYTDQERYAQANPLVRNLPPGIVAHADFRRREVVVILSQAATQPAEEVENTIRHELTHIVASVLSGDQLDVLLQEGFAQLVEHPTDTLETKIGLLRAALKANQIQQWASLDRREIFYGRPELNYPQALSVAAFLTERYSFGRVRDLFDAAGRTAGYRAALEQTYGVSADVLEQEWRAWLPYYISGGYKKLNVSGYDLTRTDTLLGQGRYDQADEELKLVVNWLRESNQREPLQAAAAAQDRVKAARTAQTDAEAARVALEQGDFAQAAELVQRAQHGYAESGDKRQDATLDDYAARAAQGQRAETALADARTLAAGLRYPQARALADQAALDFVALGAVNRAAAARDLRVYVDNRQSLAGALLLAFGLAGVFASVVRRIMVREQEVW